MTEKSKRLFAYRERCRGWKHLTVRELPKTFPSRPQGPYAALRHREGRTALNRGGTVELLLHPQCVLHCGVEFFYLMRNSQFAIRNRGGQLGKGKTLPAENSL